MSNYHEVEDITFFCPVVVTGKGGGIPPVWKCNAPFPQLDDEVNLVDQHILRLTQWTFFLNQMKKKTASIEWIKADGRTF